MESETAKRLSAMSDEGAFERLATAVLREADPRYAALSHPGVNAAGKTVKSPLDGIAFILGANPPHLVAVHHTTTKVTGLADKWLLDPKTVKPRKEKPTAPSGDLLKTAKIVADERQREPNLLATLALTTNQEPSQDLFRNVHAAGREHTIEVDIWPRSRIAHFLDSPRGQWLRYSFFGIQQEHVSKELLTKLSHDSLRISQPPGDAPEVWIERSVDTALSQARRDVVFLIADPGLGKSVASYKQLMQHVERGGYGLVVHYDLIGKSLTTVQALDLALRQLHPHLVPDAGSDALLLCEPSLPFLIVVEDINRSGQPSELLERILTWTQSDSKDENDRSRWRIICPIWPQSVLPLKDVFRKRVEGLALPCLLMTTSESRAAVRKRVSLRNRKISDMDADAIAEALGHDPLLIGLHDFEQKPDAQGVISHFVEGCLARTVALANYTTADYRMGLNAFAQEMLSRRKLDPTWTEIADWFGSADTVTCILRILVRQGEIIRLPAASGNDRISFRHDRVRDFLLTSALARHVRERKLDEDLLSDPYFAEMLGIVATGPDVPHVFIVQLEEANPLALFYAFSRVPQTDEPTDGPIVDAILR